MSALSGEFDMGGGRILPMVIRRW
ncbi:MAG: hypothetical protein RLZZ368_1120, partial [Actinomycetota bacterium]